MTATVVTSVVIAALAATAPPASAAPKLGPDASLCASNAARGGVPSNFALPACFDGSQLIVNNDLGWPLEIHADPAAGIPIVTPGPQATLPGSLTSLAAPASKGLTSPQYRLKIPIGAQRTVVSISPPSQLALNTYWATYGLYQVVGLVPLVGLGQGLVGFIGEFVQDVQNYKTCLSTAKGFFGNAGCTVGYVGNVTFAAGRAALTSLPPAKWMALVRTVLTAWDAHNAVDEASTLYRTGVTQMTINAVANSGSSSSGPSSSGPSSSGPSSSGPSSSGPSSSGPSSSGTSTQSGSVYLSKGPSAPSGYRYAIALSGWPAGTNVPVSCFDSVSPNGFYKFTLTTNSGGSASTSSYCYSNDGPDHWVTAGSIPSNHVTWSATSTPTPPPAATYAETTGSTSNTFTNYANAGGSQGAQIGSNQTVQVSCKIAGFKVADGDTWWYRVSSPPWSNSYYTPADNFYNNGATVGSLHGTPFYDPAVPNC